MSKYIYASAALSFCFAMAFSFWTFYTEDKNAVKAMLRPSIAVTLEENPMRGISSINGKKNLPKRFKNNPAFKLFSKIDQMVSDL